MGKVHQFRGIRIRSDTSITLYYKIKGVSYNETLSLQPTAENVQEAISIRKQRIDARKRGLDPFALTWEMDTPLDLTASYKMMFAFARGREGYGLSAEDEKYLISRCAGRCEITGVGFTLERNGCRRAPFAPSLDRIKSTERYTPENCRIVCVAVNYAMNEWGEWVLDKMAKSYVKHRVL